MKNLLLTFFCLNVYLISSAQQFRKCSATEVYKQHLTNDPSFAQTRAEIEQHTAAFIENYQTNNASRAVITIPVVFHVVYRNNTQNISDAQLLSQIDVLNEDFRLLNANFASTTPNVFEPLAADYEIEFCLATIDPNGNPTTGINRVATTNNGFTDDDQIKFTAQGGTNAWPRDKYLNFWVGDLSGAGLLGYAQFPGDAAATDGVVITYDAVGRAPANGFNTPYNLGRTATHEIGHWMNLYHIWGNEDSGCGTTGSGSDQVSDTPVQDDANYQCPTHPNPSCNNGGDMFVNYMDYCDDACLSMFTAGQKTRSLAIFAPGGSRAALLNSNGCSGTVNPPVTTCGDTLNFPLPGTEAVYQPSGANQTGYISGTNSFDDKGKYSKFTLSGGNSSVVGAYLKFGVANLNNAPANTQITVKVYDATGTGASPGAVLSTTTIPFSLIVQTVQNNQYVLLTYNTPITVSGAFFMGIDLNTAVGYDLALYTNQDGDPAANSAWEQFSDNSWHQYNEASSWGISVDHAIHPILGSPAASAIFNVNDNSICVGQSVTYSAIGGGIETYSWSFPGGTPSSSNTASQSVTYNSPGVYNVTLDVVSGCDGGTANQTTNNILTVTDLPVTPTITVNGAQLVSSSTTGNQWFRNGSIINGATSQTYNPSQNGNFTVRVTVNGCFSISNAVSVNFVGIDYLNTNNLQVFPNPANEELIIQLGFEHSENSLNCILLDLSGKAIINKVLNNVSPTQTIKLGTSNLSVGIYQLIIETSKGRIVRKVSIVH
jgi:hypothetical protein